LKKQNRFDQIPLSLFDRLQRILPFADKVADEIVFEETEILEKTIPRMFEVMQTVAKFRVTMSDVGISVGNHLFWTGRALMIAARIMGGAVRPEMIEEMARELTNVIEDFDQALNVEALRIAKKAGKHSLSQSENDSFSVVSCRGRDFASAAQIY